MDNVRIHFNVCSFDFMIYNSHCLTLSLEVPDRFKHCYYLTYQEEVRLFLRLFLLCEVSFEMRMHWFSEIDPQKKNRDSPRWWFAHSVSKWFNFKFFHHCSAWRNLFWNSWSFSVSGMCCVCSTTEKVHEGKFPQGLTPSGLQNV